MRSGAQISRTPREWIDHQEEERRRVLEALLLELERAREAGSEWYRWIAEGQPALTAEEYAEREGRHAPDGSPSRRQGSSQLAL